MRAKAFNILNIELDDSGRAILPEDILEKVEALVTVATAGGDNYSCENTGNGTCSNVGCIGSTNGTDCSNVECAGSTNFRGCMRGPI